MVSVNHPLSLLKPRIRTWPSWSLATAKPLNIDAFPTFPWTSHFPLSKQWQLLRQTLVASSSNFRYCNDTWRSHVKVIPFFSIRGISDIRALRRKRWTCLNISNSALRCSCFHCSAAIIFVVSVCIIFMVIDVGSTYLGWQTPRAEVTTVGRFHQRRQCANLICWFRLNFARF